MRKNFADPIAPKQIKVAETLKEISTYVGTDYGVGFRTPVGKFKASSGMPDTLPAKSKTMEAC